MILYAMDQRSFLMTRMTNLAKFITTKLQLRGEHLLRPFLDLLR